VLSSWYLSALAQRHNVWSAIYLRSKYDVDVSCRCARARGCGWAIGQCQQPIWQYVVDQHSAAHIDSCTTVAAPLIARSRHCKTTHTSPQSGPHCSLCRATNYRLVNSVTLSLVYTELAKSQITMLTIIGLTHADDNRTKAIAVYLSVLYAIKGFQKKNLQIFYVQKLVVSHMDRQTDRAMLDPCRWKFS